MPVPDNKSPCQKPWWEIEALLAAHAQAIKELHNAVDELTSRGIKQPKRDKNDEGNNP